MSFIGTLIWSPSRSRLNLPGSSYDAGRIHFDVAKRFCEERGYRLEIVSDKPGPRALGSKLDQIFDQLRRSGGGKGARAA